MNRKINLGSLIIILLFILLSINSGSISFLVMGVICLWFAHLIKFFVFKSQQESFLKLVLAFFLLYSVLVAITHNMFIFDPFGNSYVGIDELTFFDRANDLAKLPYSKLWNFAFVKYRYSDSQFAYAWMATLDRLAHLSPYYSLLFLKMNSAFIGSFIPAIVYLLLCRFINKDKAFRCAIIYGLFSFTLFYSIGLMRDIHIALIYAIGLYIISGTNYNIRNYLFLIILGFLAFFIRIENGLFYVAFLGVWMLGSKVKNKGIIIFFSLLLLISALYIAGGISTIFDTAEETTSTYQARSIAVASSQSFGVLLNRLPVPFNYLSKTIFGQMQPFPFWLPISSYKGTFWQKIFYIFPAIAGIFWCAVWLKIIAQFEKVKPFFKRYKWLVALALLYIVLNSIGEFNPRRMMAVYPVIFMGVCSIPGRLFKGKDWILTSIVYGLLIVVYIMLQIMF